MIMTRGKLEIELKRLLQDLWDREDALAGDFLPAEAKLLPVDDKMSDDLVRLVAKVWGISLKARRVDVK